ncbi:FAD binding domain-containing protein [Variovorax paradoxus]|uniref:FAD binding domain-containing protein n=1 Tax=Variovorax paradoxus TaxID=34073 RepID=UPI001ABC88E0
MKAVIAGGSLGGLFAAHMLRRRGWTVEVHERVEQALQGRGAGIVTHPALLEALRALGLPADDTLGVRVAERIVLAHDGSVRGHREVPQLLTAWSRLFHLLRTALPDECYRSASEIVGFEQDDERVRIRLSNGREVEAALLVAADGLRSAIRKRLLPGAEPRYAGYVAWRGMVDEAVLSAPVRERVFPHFVFDLPPHEQLVAYPIAGADNSVAPGRRRFNFVWYRPADEHGALRDLLTDAEGRHWPEGIPPPRVRPEVLAGARRAAAEVLSPQCAEVIAKAANLFFQPIFDLESPRLAFGRVALLGDAAFVARPHCGMGVSKAADDASALAEALAGTAPVAEALQDYERRRQPEGTRIVAHARALGAYMQAQLRTDEERAMAERHRSPEAVMRETAMPITPGVAVD